ncbi:Glycosyltransferase Family 34 protein [Gigaspora rosea]|uniref:Glycosyltransferase Family 34 protein n=1 Tax=Gigaspora rosea TaxID=44941 RepID=A0A397UGU5_9GLOM|nr:Glycosyltransferase Family 34 protein [Gigaspora rosea]
MHLGPNEDSIEGAIKDEDIFLNPPPNLDDHLDHPIIYPINGGNIQPRHYKLLIAITSQIDEIRTRKLLREYMFGIRNNLKPCMENNGDIYYKFLVKPYNQAEKKVLRDFTAEVVEFDDIEEFPNQPNLNWQKTVFTWIQSIEKQEVTYDYVVIIEDHSVINLHKLLTILDSSVVNTHTLTTRQKSNLIWGRFDAEGKDEMFMILGPGSITTLLELEYFVKGTRTKKQTPKYNIITQAYHYFIEQNHSDESDLFFINDNIGLIEWPNAVENIPIKTTIGVGHVYLESEMKDVFAHLSISKITACYPVQLEDGKLSIAVVTSSFVYDNMCMYPIAYPLAENKRSYAKKHGYSFVGRSEEFDQQAHYKNRRTVWGKIDSVEKILPHYDWLFWLDMDTVIANQSITVEWLFDRFSKMVGGKDNFKKINLVVARPKQDATINAGVFMIRNSEWSRRFLRTIQQRRDLYHNHQMEQRAMWDLLNTPEYRQETLLLDKDDHTFNTFPHMYAPGDFVVHWAPDDCPVKPILDAIGKFKQFEKNKDFKFTLNHPPDH